MALAVNGGKPGKRKGGQMAKEFSSPKSSKGNTQQVCVFCSTGADEGKYGKMFTKKGLSVHYFCMLFSSGLGQNGESEKQGILGFLQDDILKEVKRGSRLRCSYCQKVGATIGCVVNNCKKMFHFGCGRSNGTMHQFFGTFCSYCPRHCLKQDVPPDNDPNFICSICTNIVNAYPSYDTLRAPCCKHYWYHRDCLQAYAMSAGLHFFKCPLCNNKDDFQDEMLKMGIYVPDQDASWEKEPNAFQELLERYNRCDAVDCKCDKGRTFSKDESKWEMILCDFCGSHGSHKACKHLIKHGKHKICQDCKSVEDMSNGSCSKRKSLEALQFELNSPNTSKAASLYPGPSSAMKKKGVPISNGTKKKRCSKNLSKRIIDDLKVPPAKKVRRYKTAVDSNAKSGASNSVTETVNLNWTVLEKSLHKVAKKVRKGNGKRKNHRKKIHSGLNRSQSILRDWLQSKKLSESGKKLADSKPLTPLQSLPRKKTPMFVNWEGKELLIKSPRVVIHRKRIYSRKKNLNPNLTIDMNDGKLGSDWHMEMELLANIDTDQRVTRNMVDINAAKGVMEHTDISSKTLTLYDISPKKELLPLFPEHTNDDNRKLNRKDVTPKKEQFLPLYPDFTQTNKPSSVQLSCKDFYNLEKKGSLLKNKTYQNSSHKRRSLKTEHPEKNTGIEKYFIKCLSETKHGQPSNTDICADRSGDNSNVPGVNEKIPKSKKKTWLNCNSLNESTASYCKDTNILSPVFCKVADTFNPRKSAKRNGKTRARSCVPVSNEDKTLSDEVTLPFVPIQKNEQTDSNTDKQIALKSEVQSCEINGFLHQSNENPSISEIIPRKTLSTKKYINSDYNETPPRNKPLHDSYGPDDSPAKNLRLRKLANETKLDKDTTSPIYEGIQRKNCFQLDRCYPKLNTTNTTDLDHGESNDEWPVLRMHLMCDLPAKRKSNSEFEIMPAKKKAVPPSCSLDDSPAKYTRQRKEANDIGKFKNVNKINDTDLVDKGTCNPDLLDWLKKYYSQLDKRHPMFRTVSDSSADHDCNHNNKESQIFTKVITHSALPSKKVHTSEDEMTPPRNKHVSESLGLADSPAKNLRQRKLANDFENKNKVDVADKKFNRLKKYSFPVDQYYPALADCTADHSKVSSPPVLEKVSSCVEQQKETGVYWHFDGTRQISNSSSNFTSKDISTKTLLSDNMQPMSSISSYRRSSPRRMAFLSSPMRSRPRNKVSSDDTVVDTLSDLQNFIPSYNLCIDSEEDVCDTSKNLSPIFSTKFRKFLSRSKSSDSISLNTLDRNLSKGPRHHLIQ